MGLLVWWLAVLVGVVYGQSTYTVLLTSQGKEGKREEEREGGRKGGRLHVLTLLVGYDPRGITVNLEDSIRFQWGVEGSVTSGNADTCQKSSFPSVQFDSGVQPVGYEWVLPVSFSGGFERGNTYGYFSTSSCRPTSSFNVSGTISIAGPSPHTQAGIAIGLSVGFAFLIVCVLFLSLVLRHSWNRVYKL